MEPGRFRGWTRMVFGLPGDDEPARRRAVTCDMDMDLPQSQARIPSRLNGSGVCFWYQSTRVGAATASCRYRIGNLVEHLIHARAVVGHKLPNGALSGMHTLVCVRPVVTPSLAQTLARARRQGVRIVGDYDDLLFDCAIGEFPHAQRAAADRSALAKRLGAYRAGLRHFDAFTTSTETIAARLHPLAPGVPITVVPNGVSESWARQGRLVYEAWRPGDRKVIRYFPGSRTHDPDYKIAEPTLQRFLRERADVDLEVVGFLEWDPSMFPEGRAVHRAAVPYAELPRWLASSWVNVAPLAATAYNAARSAVKYVEAAAFNCPTIATPGRDMERHLGNGLAFGTTTETWLRALRDLLDDEERQRAGTRAREWVDEEAGAARSARIFCEALAC